ncbi:four helix bundle protein [Formosa haliotis]|uniref:four helix bundle protein n=1 Tax=Formosa haliotis TaxID=1555194 RepID=UPI000826D91B|nr:four helix bundle protein [Formosa haliotis]
MNDKNPYFKFEDLQVYQKALDFVDAVYVVTKTFPKNETYQLTSQFQRAAISIALNISEGQGRTNAQFNRFIQISIGSVNECVVCSTIAFRLGYIKEDQDVLFRRQLEELSKMLSGLTKYLKK